MKTFWSNCIKTYHFVDVLKYTLKVHTLVKSWREPNPYRYLCLKLLPQFSRKRDKTRYTCFLFREDVHAT